MNAPAADSRKNASRSLIIKAGTLINGTGAPARLNAFVYVVGGMIKSICGVPPRLAGPDRENFLDLSHCTLLPPLIDCHVHLFMDAGVTGARRERCLRTEYKKARPVIRRNIDHHRRCGLMAVRDGGDPGGYAVRYKKETLKHDEAFCLKTSGRAWYKPGRYGAIVGGSPLSGRALLQAMAEELEHVDQIKLIHSGLNSLKDFGRQTEPQFQPEELAAVVALARKKNRRVMVHANGEIPVRLAVEAGVDSIEHGFFMGRENLDRLAEKEIFWVPTAVTMRSFVSLGRPGAEVAARNLESQLSLLSRARQAGVRVALGTDAGCPGVDHGGSIRKELELLVMAGFSLEQAIQSATSHGAALLGLPRAGLLTPGMPADFLAVAGGLDALPRSLARVTLFSAGRRNAGTPLPVRSRPTA